MAAINRLLIVDDERDITRLIEIAARELGYDVLAINDTDLFEKSIQQFNPTIIMLDIAMPGRDGVELMGHLSAGGYQGKIVVMSGSHPSYIQMSSTIATVRGLNLAGSLAKPFRRQMLMDLLASLAIASTAQQGLPFSAASANEP
jgi:DNA-binding response OmpR family regulator